jgi:hypothetical protein
MEEMENIFNEVLEWHKLNGIKNRKQHEKRDCLGKLTDPRDQAYYDLMEYYGSKSKFSEIEIEFFLFCQRMWLLEFACAVEPKNETWKKVFELKTNFFETEKRVIAENHYLSRFSKEQRLPHYQRKTFLEKDCCYKLTHTSKYYYEYFVVDGAKLKRQVQDPLGPLISIGKAQLKESKKLIFAGFYELDSKFLEVPVFNVEDKNGKKLGIILFNETKSNGNKRVALVREDYEKLNTYGNYERDVYCPISYIEM